MANNKISDKDYEEMLMGILNGDLTAAKGLKDAAKEEVKPAAGPDVVYEHGHIIEVNGEKVAKGYTPTKGKGSGAKRSDKTREGIKDMYTRAIKNSAFGANIFMHSTEGLIVRLEEADYAIKITRSKEFKVDASAADFKVERDFTTRGKTKNSTAAIARLLDKTFTENGDNIVDVTATAITMHSHNPEENKTVEYVVKISKKRSRVGFEAEKGETYIK